MRGPWLVLLAFFGVAVAAALVYTLGGSALQMRALLNDTAAVTPPAAGQAMAPPRSATAPALDETGAALDLAAPLGSSAVPEEGAGFENPQATTEPEDPRAGPPSGAEFAELLEAELAGDADPAAVEALRRALREVSSVEQ